MFSLRGLVLSLCFQVLAVRLGFRLRGLGLVFNARFVRSGVALRVVLQKRTIHERQHGK